MGNYGDALRVLENLFRNTVIRCGHDLVQHSAGMIQPVDCCFAIRFCPSGASHTQTEYCHHRHKLLHATHHFFYLCAASLAVCAFEAHKVSLTLVLSHEMV